MGLEIRGQAGNPSENADEDEIGINKRRLQQDEDHEAQNGHTPIKPALDFPPLNPFLFRLHADG